jgi:hypothetical protein
MFCPQCRVEYRPGFTHCTDCHVDLVPSLAQAEQPTSSDGPGGSLQILWEGEDLALFEDLLDGLEAASIRYFDQPLGIYPGVRRAYPFPVQPMARFGYQVAVLSSDLDRAREILGKLLEEEPKEMELPALDEKLNDRPERIARADEDLTFELWSETDKSLAEFLEAGLKENGIASRTERQTERITVYVSPEDESAAREILREIVEGAPPGEKDQE